MRIQPCLFPALAAGCLVLWLMAGGIKPVAIDIPASNRFEVGIGHWAPEPQQEVESLEEFAEQLLPAKPVATEEPAKPPVKEAPEEPVVPLKDAGFTPPKPPHLEERQPAVDPRADLPKIEGTLAEATPPQLPWWDRKVPPTPKRGECPPVEKGWGLIAYLLEGKEGNTAEIVYAVTVISSGDPVIDAALNAAFVRGNEATRRKLTQSFANLNPPMAPAELRWICSPMPLKVDFEKQILP